MTLRIQCPSCRRQFRIGSELNGRTVECGACEHQFVVSEETIVKQKNKFYPGEVRGAGLEGFSRMPSPANRAVDFQTASYSEAATPADVLPMSPQQVVAMTIGVLTLVGFALFLIVGVQAGLFFKDMDLGKRIVLAGFVVMMGGALILYAGRRRLKGGMMTAGVLGAAVMILAVFLPVPRTIPAANLRDASSQAGQPSEPVVPRRMTARDVLERVGYKPVRTAIERSAKSGGGPEEVVAIWVPRMEERFKYQIQKFLHRKTRTGERPSYYRRDDGALFVLEGVKVSLAEVEALIDRFGRVDETYPEIRVVMATVEGERLLDASPELMRKLKDKGHPAFYVRNKSELEHIDLDRVRDAVQRLADAEPKRFQPEITRRLIELVKEEDEPELQDLVCRALMVWSKPSDGATAVVAAEARELLVNNKPLPQSMVEFLVAREAPEAIPIAETLWARDPAAWEPILASVGPEAEVVIRPHLGDDDRAVRLSAARLLRRIGTAESLPALRSALASETDDTDMETMLRSAIAEIEGAS